MPGPWELPGSAPSRRPRLPWRVRPGLWLWLAAMAGMAALLLVLNRLFPDSLDEGSSASLLQWLGWFALLSSGLLFVRRINLKRAARNLLLWLGVAGVLLLGFAARDPLLEALTRLRGALVPGYAAASGAHALTLSENDSGSYQVYGSVNGVKVRFLIDTGASDIVLTGRDAQAAGIDLAALDYSRPFATANGIAHGATAEVEELKVGGIIFNDVQVSVQRQGLATSLLGMSFLRRLKSFGFSQHQMVLRW